MNAIDAVRSALRQYATFRGRARRSEFWWFTLFTVLVGVVASGIDVVVFGSRFDEFGPVYLLTYLPLVLPNLALNWRRLHDTDHSGAWTFFALVPVVGWIVFLVFVCSDSNPWTNRFGPSPKHPDPRRLQHPVGTPQHG